MQDFAGKMKCRLSATAPDNKVEQTRLIVSIVPLFLPTSKEIHADFKLC